MKRKIPKERFVKFFKADESYRKIALLHPHIQVVSFTQIVECLKITLWNKVVDNKMSSLTSL
ncbi:CLUMA_CG017125, isoform A [Clunio marinus]|uniref:CLUMA_CG017125, isoform A n=1 Tax=Clunio marinus TaxID=568069 RepID=A0A1J1IUZ7_9DIPT|nr:CLUMA_CG017125, isoform A [Clunio marinus]